MLGQQGFEVSQKLVSRLLRQLDYSCQANSKTREGTNHPDRNAQFEYINAGGSTRSGGWSSQRYRLIPRRRSLSETSRMAGGNCVPRRPEPVRVHDFAIPGLGKVAPYGVYDIAANAAGSISGSTPIPPRSRWRAFVAGGRNWDRPAIRQARTADHR